jgi:hypothetical protein
MIVGMIVIVRFVFGFMTATKIWILRVEAIMSASFSAIYVRAYACVL